MFNVQLGCFFGVVRCVVRVALRCVRVMSGYLVVTFFMVFGGFAMVNCRVLVVLRCLFGHGRPLLSRKDVTCRVLTLSPICYGKMMRE